MIDILERFLPGLVQRLYASGVERGLLERSMNGTMSASLALAAVGVALFVFRRRLCAFALRIEGPKTFLLTLTALSILSFPDPVFPMRPGLDYSWQWMLNRLAFSRDWGNSIVFTYGPLGWLLFPSGRWATVLLALAADMGFCLLWMWSLRRIYRSSEGGRVVAWGLLFTMLFPQGSMEWRWVALAIVLTRASWVGAGVVLAALSFVKFNVLVVVAGTQMFLALADRRPRDVSRWIVGFVVAFAMLSMALFPFPQAFWAWAVGSVQIAVGYNSHMLVEKTALALALPVVAFLVLAHRPRHFMSLLPFTPLLYCTAKYGWIRQGPEPFLYSLMVAGAFMMEKFVAERRRIAIAAAVFLVVGYGLTWPRFFAAGQTYYAFPFGVNPIGILRTVALPCAKAKAEARADKMLETSHLPAGIRMAIGESAVQLLPHEFSPAMADPSLKIVPYATMQMYSTYTSWLDRFAADSYGGAGAPNFIVVKQDELAIDGKNAFLDCPRTWAAIRANYFLCDADGENGRWLLLKRRATPKRITCDRRVAIPAATFGERLLSLVFRGKPRYSEIAAADGELQRVRVNPLVLNDPIDPDLPLTADGLVQYLAER